jgi:hypothetical protein
VVAHGRPASLPEHLTPDQRVAVWLDLMDVSEALLLAGPRLEIGPDGDLHEAYRHWWIQQSDVHDQALRRLAENLYRRGVRHGR